MKAGDNPCLAEAAQMILERLPADIDQLSFEWYKGHGGEDDPNLLFAVPIVELPLYDYLVYQGRTAMQNRTVNPGDLSFIAACSASDALAASKSADPIVSLVAALSAFEIEQYRTDRTPLDYEHPEPWYAIGEYVVHDGQPGSIGVVTRATREDGWTSVNFANPDPFFSGTTWCQATELHHAGESQIAVFPYLCKDALAQRERVYDERKNPTLDADTKRGLENRLKFFLYEFGVRNVITSIASTLESDAARTEEYGDMPALHQSIIDLAICYMPDRTGNDEEPF